MNVEFSIDTEPVTVCDTYTPPPSYNAELPEIVDWRIAELTGAVEGIDDPDDVGLRRALGDARLLGENQQIEGPADDVEPLVVARRNEGRQRRQPDETGEHLRGVGPAARDDGRICVRIASPFAAGVYEFAVYGTPVYLH